MLKLRTQRLLLRPFRMSDAMDFSAYRSDPAVARYQSWETPYPLEAARELIDEMLKRGTVPWPGQWNQVAVELAEGGGVETLIGDCAFRILASEPGTACVGFTLTTRFWGKGYATEAASAVIAWLFDAAGMQRVVADCDARNLASQRVLERLGMRRAGEAEVAFKGEVVRELRFEMGVGSR